MRIAVLGTYRSGSSAIAGVLHHLGVHMGSSFWGDHYEAADLSQALRRWWSEPKLVSATAAHQRVQQLKAWIDSRQRDADIVGAKHPLLSLCGPEILEAWGDSVCFVWCRRPLQESIDSLQRTGWWSDAERIQRRLHEANEAFFSERECLQLHFSDTLGDPERQVHTVLESLGLEASPEQIEQAIQWIEVPAERRQPVQPGNMSPQVAKHQSTQIAGAIQAPKIVATLLSGNSASIVRDAVESVINLVDEVCLIDTGITDDTEQIVRAVTDEKFHCAKFPWCNDFSAARNFALELAEARGATWALTLDTDERIEMAGVEGRQQLLQQLEADPDVQTWMVSARDGTYSKERFIRIPTQLRWSGRTHEALVGARKIHRRQLSGSHFWEVRRTTDQYQHKLDRDLAILLQETASQPLNPRWWYYLGQTYEGLQQPERAIEAFERCIRLDGWQDESAWACYCAARCWVALEEYREAEEYCGLGMTRKPTSAEFPWLAGWCCFQRGALQQAVAWSELGVVLGRDKRVENAASFRHVPAWYEAPFDVLRHVFKQLGHSDRAHQAEENYHSAKQARLRLHPKADPWSVQQQPETSDAGDE